MGRAWPGLGRPAAGGLDRQAALSDDWDPTSEQGCGRGGGGVESPARPVSLHPGAGATLGPGLGCLGDGCHAQRLAGSGHALARVALSRDRRAPCSRRGACVLQDAPEETLTSDRLLHGYCVSYTEDWGIDRAAELGLSLLTDERREIRARFLQDREICKVQGFGAPAPPLRRRDRSGEGQRGRGRPRSCHALGGRRPFLHLPRHTCFPLLLHAGSARRAATRSAERSQAPPRRRRRGV